MMPIKQLAVAVIGDEDLVSGLRLAGISRYSVIEEAPDAREEVRKALSDLIDDRDVGVIVILEDYVKHAEDLIAKLKGSRRLTPVIIEVPSRYGTVYGDVRDYYKKYARQFIGFDVEI